MTGGFTGPLPRVQLRKIPMGALLEIAGRLWLRTVAYMVGATLLIIVPGLLLLGLIVVLLGLHSGTIGVASWFLLFALSEMCLFVTFGVAFAVCEKLASESMFGGVSFFGCVRHCVKSALSILWIYVLIGFIIFVVALPLDLLAHLPLVFGVIARIALLVFTYWFYVATSFSIPSLILHGNKGMAALSRSTRLIRGSWWRCFGINAVVIVVMFGTVFALDVLLGQASAFEATHSLVSANIGLVLLGLGVPLAVFLPISACVNFLLYLDLSAAADGIIDAEDIGWRMGSRPEASGLIFRLARLDDGETPYEDPGGGPRAPIPMKPTDPLDSPLPPLPAFRPTQPPM